MNLEVVEGKTGSSGSQVELGSIISLGEVDPVVVEGKTGSSGSQVEIGSIISLGGSGSSSS